MKKILLMTMLLGGAVAAGAEDLAWLTDAAKAQTQAKADKKLVLLDFTGSDWCGWCVRLQKEVFSKPEFAEYAKKNLVLVEVDFPRRKKIAPEQEKANNALAAKYKVGSFPTLIILDSTGRKVGTLGYMDGGPKPFIAELEKLKKKAG